jgi:hypothetical protein
MSTYLIKKYQYEIATNKEFSEPPPMAQEIINALKSQKSYESGSQLIQNPSVETPIDAIRALIGK